MRGIVVDKKREKNSACDEADIKTNGPSCKLVPLLIWCGASSISMVHVCKIVFIDDIVICNLVGDLQAAAGAEGKHHQSFDALEKVTSTIHILINVRMSTQVVQSIHTC